MFNKRVILDAWFRNEFVAPKIQVQFLCAFSKGDRMAMYPRSYVE